MPGRLLTAILDRLTPPDRRYRCSVCGKPLALDSEVYTVADTVYCSVGCLRDSADQE